MKIAHISDIHFFVPSFKVSHLFTNEWLGNLNVYYSRRNFFITENLDAFISSLLKEKIDVLVITGDFTSTANGKEFALAKEFIQKVLDSGIRVFGLPGNHDMYTKKSVRHRTFYHCLDNLPIFSHGHLHFETLTDSWNIILLDTTMHNKIGRANGHFTLDHEKTLHHLLDKSSNVIVANHFPLEDKSKTHHLIRDKHLHHLLRDSKKQVLYLHGHTHNTSYHQETDQFHVFNSSESTVTEKFHYHLIDLTKDQFSHRVVKYYE